MAITMIPVSKLEDGMNTRNGCDVDDLIPLIRSRGIENPLLVYKANGLWIVHEGHRRLAAARILGLAVVPCTEIRPPVDQADAIISQMMINNSQKPFSYTENAKGWSQLVVLGKSQKEIAEQFGVSEPQVSLALKAVALHPKLQQALDENRISSSAIEPLLPLSQDIQGELADAAIRAKTVIKVRALVQADKAKRGLGRGSKPATMVPAEADPQEVLAVTALGEAVEILTSVKDQPITDPDLRAQGRKTVKEILAIARHMQKVCAG